MKRGTLFLFLIAGILQQLSGQTFYVSTSGSDARNSTQAQTITTPWRTIQHACDNAVPGCTLSILGGTYIEEVYMNTSGTAGNYITIKNYNTDVVLLSGNATAKMLFDINNRNYIRIEGLHFTNAIGNNSTGLLIEGTSHHIEVLNNKFYNICWSATPGAIPTASKNAQPLIVYGTNGSTAINNLLIQGNELYDNRPGFSEVLAVNGNVDGFTVLNNLVHHNQNIGIDIIGHEGTSPNASTDQARNGLIKGNTVYKCSSVYDGSAAGIYVDGGKDLIIENNITYRNDWGIEIGCENPGTSTSNITVRNNLIFRNTKAGIQLGGYDGPVNTGKVVNAVVRNNTFFANDSANTDNGEISLTYSENCSFLNNIVYAGSTRVLADGWWGGPSPNLTFDYNLYYSLSGSSATLEFDLSANSYTGLTNFKSGSGKDANSTFQNPQLINNSTVWPDLHIASSSPAKDAGVPSFVTGSGELDMDGQNRVDNSRVDIGADEYQTTLGLVHSSPWNELEKSPLECRIFPNPVQHILTCDWEEKITRAELHSANGNDVIHLHDDQEIFLIPSTIKPGVYLLILESAHHRCTKKILIE